MNFVLRDFYRDQLLESCLPFWLAHAPNRKDGGYYTCLGRDGSVYDADKPCLWSHGRIAWVFAYVYNRLDARAEWLEMARLGIDFLQRYGFAPDGSMYYGLTHDGRPLIGPRDIHVETSTILGFSEYAKATRDAALYARARSMCHALWERIQIPGRSDEPFLAQTRPMRLHAHYLILMNVWQTLRDVDDDPSYDPLIETCYLTIRDTLQRPKQRAIFEAVAWDGGDLPGWMGRWVNPGHMIEAGIFTIREGIRRRQNDWIAHGANWIDWGFAQGWDPAYGGIFNDIDIEGMPVPTVDGALRYASKLWWQHTEALYGLLLAYAVTGRKTFLDAHDRTLDYVKTHYLDPEHGDWFGMLDRTGLRLSDAKGTERKSLFHLARNLFHAWQLCEHPLPLAQPFALESCLEFSGLKDG